MTINQYWSINFDQSGHTRDIKVHGFDGQNNVIKTVQLHDSDQSVSLY